MTDREAMQQALHALETKGEHHPRVYAAITTLITALKQQAEPVAWNAGVPPMWPQQKEGETFSVAYTAPPQREWVGLTDEEMSDIVADIDVDFGDLLWKVVCLTKIIEATLKERNK